MTADLILKYWIQLSLVLALTFVVWNYIPILIPLAVVGGTLAAFTLLVRRLADRYRRNHPEPSATQSDEP